MSITETLIVFFMAVVSLAFQVFIVVVGVVIAWRWLHRQSGAAGTASRFPESSALQILEERYARGEIEAPEFEERRARIAGRERTPV